VGRNSACALSPAEQAFVCVYELEAEVNNGGFDQFLRNSPGQHALETVAALEAIGASSMAEITRQAVALIFPDGTVPRDQADRISRLDADEGTLDELQSLDRRFYEYPDDLTELLFRYVQRHRESIRGAKPA
jgi:hypothetical protein